MFEAVKDETWRELVQRIGRDEFGVDVGTDEVEFILWERTAFPFGNVDGVVDQMRKYFDDQMRNNERTNHGQ